MSLSKIIQANDAEALYKWQTSTKSREEREVTEQKNLLTAEQIEEIQKQAYQEGFEEGRHQGLIKGEAEVKQKIQQLVQVVDVLQKPLEQLDDTIEQELVTLAMVIARQIIRRELKIDPTHVIAAVREAVGQLPLASRNIRIFLHPEDSEVVRNSLGNSKGERRWEIMDDATQSRGGCRVVTETSQLDATVERRLAAIVASIFGDEREQSE